MNLPIQALRVKLASATLAAVALTASHAVAKNHDAQPFKPSSTAVALHDRAPGPVLRVPN